MNFTLTEGLRYRAILSLNLIESFVGNEEIVNLLQKHGFRDIAVLGDGETRTAEGTWANETTVVALDQHIISIKEV